MTACVYSAYLYKKQAKLIRINRTKVGDCNLFHKKAFACKDTTTIPYTNFIFTIMKDIRPIKRNDDYTCDEGVDISQFRKGWDKEKIRKIYEKLEKEKGQE